MTLLYFIITVITVLLIVILSILLWSSYRKNEASRHMVDTILREILRVETAVKTESGSNRRETFDQAAIARKELSHSLFSFEEKLIHLTDTVDHKLGSFSQANNNTAAVTRKEIRETLESFKNDLSQSIHAFNALQKENILTLLQKQSEQNTNTNTCLENMRQTLEKKIGELQRENEQKLEQMRMTVDEKLQQTLEARLGESFRLVSERLEAVHKGLGDMQQLATGVGDLKRVLSNVKTRGILGEYQLEGLLQQLLTPEQYCKNVRTKPGNNAVVEFAVKLPGRQGDENCTVWLPIDSKFPKEAFEQLIDAYENANTEVIEDCRRIFIKDIRNCAMDISFKYIDPPHTTDFAILFLPFESLYAEVLRTAGLFENIQREYRVTITGPTTLSALLNSLQMGFRTLAIEKRSGEVWQLLSAVKTEFGNFSALLQKAQNNIQTGLNQLEDLAGKRTRAIEKRLKGVQTITTEKVEEILPELSTGEITEDD